jgi:hypothetical protein
MIPKSSLPKSKRPNIKPQRGLGQAVSRQRRKANDALKRQREGRIQRDRQNAREMLNRKSNRLTPEELLAQTYSKNLLSATLSNQRAVMHSYGIDLPVHSGTYYDWTGDGSIKAYTDFESIVMRLPLSMLPQNDASPEAIIDFVATLRGVFQHELGHVRFTVPFQNLSVSDDVDYGKRTQLHWVWNCLEDQRMETAVVKAVPVIASYFTKMIAVHILSKTDTLDRAWLLLAGRRYLPTSMRQQAHDVFAQQNGAQVAAEWRQIVAEYVSATTNEDLSAQVIKAYDFLMAHGLLDHDLKDDSHGGHTSREADPKDSASEDNPSDDEVQAGEDSGEGEGNKSDEAGSDAGEDGESGSAGEDGESDANGTGEGGKSDTAGDDDAAGEGDGQSDAGKPSDTAGANGESDTDVDAQRPGGGVTTGKVDTDKLQNAINEALEQATNEMRADKTNSNIIKDANELQNRDGSLPWLGVHEAVMPADLQATADQLAIGMEQALSDFVTASQPVWQSHQEHGIIDPISFRTKSVGDNAYRRGMDGDANAGLDLHVSLLCDASASMSGDPMVALSQVLYATANACDRLGIGTSYTLWSSPGENYRVEAGEPVIWPVLGGTEPTEALDDLDSHNPEGASNHLVIIFTDGEWEDNFPGLHQWERPGRHIVLVEYNRWTYEDTADRRGADEAFLIKDILQMPAEMTAVIANILSR